MKKLESPLTLGLVILNYLFMAIYTIFHLTDVYWHNFATTFGLWGFPVLYIITGAVLVLLGGKPDKLTRYLFALYSLLLISVIIHLVVI